MIPIISEQQNTFSIVSDDIILEHINKYFAGIPIRCERIEKYLVIFTTGMIDEVETAYDNFYVYYYHDSVFKNNTNKPDIIIRYVTKLQ